MYISENCNWTPFGTDPKKDRFVKSRDYEKRLAAAQEGYGLDILVNDSLFFIREEVARHGYGLDKLINDPQFKVRLTVAERGYGLDELVNDKDSSIRAEVARQRYGLDKLVNDKYYDVRREVARQGYGLDKLVNDKHPFVRLAVAERGYGLDKLVNDDDFDVHKAATEYLKNAGYKDIFDWVQHNPDKACRTNNSIIHILRDIINKAANSKKLAIQTSCSSINVFFDEAFADDNEAILTICTVDTKNTLVKFQKTVVNNEPKFTLIVDITDMYGDKFTINSTIISQKQLNALILQTIEILRADRQLSKYADDLEDCL